MLVNLRNLVQPFQGCAVQSCCLEESPGMLSSHPGSGILVLSYGLPAQRILKVGDHRLQGIQPGFGATLKAQQNLLGAGTPPAGTPAIGGAPPGEALAVAADEFQLIHAAAGVGVEGGDAFVIVEVQL